VDQQGVLATRTGCSRIGFAIFCFDLCFWMRVIGFDPKGSRWENPYLFAGGLLLPGLASAGALYSPGQSPPRHLADIYASAARVCFRGKPQVEYRLANASQ
jgi:hypothetical protein